MPLRFTPKERIRFRRMKSYYFIALLVVLAIGCEENPPLTAESDEAPEVKAEAAQPEVVATRTQAECPCKDGKCPKDCCEGKAVCEGKEMAEADCGCKKKPEVECPKKKAGDCPFARARAEAAAAGAE